VGSAGAAPTAPGAGAVSGACGALSAALALAHPTAAESSEHFSRAVMRGMAGILAQLPREGNASG
jgi:hypothetical protein